MVLETLTALINKLLHEPYAGLLAGILFGVKASISKELYEALIVTGTLHIVALSGTNISIVTGFVNLILLRFIARPIANIFTMVLIMGYIALVGLSPSVIRAAIMGCLSLFAVSFGRQRWLFWSWFVASVTMLAFRPAWVADLSFQLSVMATLGIILFGSSGPDAGRCAFLEYATPRTDGDKEVLERGLAEASKNVVPTSAAFAEILKFIKSGLRLTLAAQIFTIPIIMFSFHRISLVSPLSNVLIAQLVAPITVLGFIVVALGLVWLPLGQVAAWVVWAPLALLVWIVEVTSKIPFASIGW